MPAGGPGRFEQACNAQAAVEIESRLIVGEHVTQATNDKEQLVPTPLLLRKSFNPTLRSLLFPKWRCHFDKQPADEVR